jgi:hypothetical protein
MIALTILLCIFDITTNITIGFGGRRSAFTDDISHVTFVLFIFECVHHMGRSLQIKYLRLYFNVLVFEA